MKIYSKTFKHTIPNEQTSGLYHNSRIIQIRLHGKDSTYGSSYPTEKLSTPDPPYQPAETMNQKVSLLLQ